jgi:hypothetical protein
MTVTTHQIGGITFRTETNLPIPQLNKYVFTQFCSNDSEPHVHYRIHRTGFDEMNSSPPAREELMRFPHVLTFSKNGLESPLLRVPAVRAMILDCIHQPGEVKIFCDRNLVVFHDFIRKELSMFYTEKLGGFSEEHQKYLPEHFVSANLLHIFSSFLPTFSALLFHSAGVIRKGKAAIFLAPDGGGKTTVVNHATDTPILSDDQVIFRKEDDTVVAHGTPLGAMSSGPCKAGLGGLFLLKKASRFELTPLKPTELVQYLWAEHRNYMFSFPKRLKTEFFRILSDVCYSAPAFRMHFSKDHVDWDAIDFAMEKCDAG